MNEFEEFWSKYPRRIGKLAALKAFQKARQMASLAEILSGIDVYLANKPDYADFCHPSTWLNQGRWMDEPDQRSGEDRRQTERRRETWGFDCPHTPLCRNHFACVQLQKKVG